MLTSSNRTNTRHTWASYDYATQVHATWRGDGPAGNDWDYVAYSNHASIACSTTQQVLRHVRWPASTPGGQHLRQWLDTLLRPGQAAQDAAAAATAGTGTDNTRTIT